MYYKLGLVGFPLGHSLSPRIHEIFLSECSLDGEYRLYPVSPERSKDLEQLVGRLRDGEVTGLNITIPHKQAILRLVDDVTQQAKNIGAVNTLFLRDGKVYGDNTDADGFLVAAEKIVAPGLVDKKALILGAGGAARAVTYSLLRDSWKITVAEIDMRRAIDLVASLRLDGDSLDCIPIQGGIDPGLVKGLDLIVNATPVGMHPRIGDSPWPEENTFPPSAVLFDLVYNPRDTLLMKQARNAGLETASGLGMLVEQAALSFECWTGIRPPREKVMLALEKEC